MKERSMRTRHRAAFMAAVLAVVMAAAACSSDARTTAPRVVRGASPDAGKRMIVRYGCGACHEIPGIREARGLVAPPLIHFGRRGTIAGERANTPDNLTQWIHDPQSIEPGTDMPNLGISVVDARNIAAYLETLQ
jgi:cytochrome c1